LRAMARESEKQRSRETTGTGTEVDALIPSRRPDICIEPQEIPCHLKEVLDGP
jgi:hypothetical protein